MHKMNGEKSSSGIFTEFLKDTLHKKYSSQSRGCDANVWIVARKILTEVSKRNLLLASIMQSLCGKWTGMNYSWQLNETFFAVMLQGLTLGDKK